MTPKFKFVVGSHDEKQLLPFGDAIYQRAFFPNLTYPQQVSPGLAENQFFVSDEALSLDAQYIGFFSPRFTKRYESFQSIEELTEVLADMEPGSVWSPDFLRITTNAELNYWIESQDSFLPGISRILRGIRQTHFPNSRPNGIVFLGNQFVVNRATWLSFITSWRKCFYSSDFNKALQISFRCLNCGKHRPLGYFRYSQDRKLAFLGERITALIFAFSGLKPALGAGYDPKQTSKEDLTIKLIRIFPFLSRLSRLINLLAIAKKLPNRFACNICSNSSDANLDSYRFLRKG